VRREYGDDAVAEKTRAEFSKDVLADRAIGDRVYALVPKKLFDRLDPLARARYWVARERWADAEAAYKLARERASMKEGTARFSNDLLADRAIGDRFHALAPASFFELLHPLARARYWVARERWSDAEAAYRQASGYFQPQNPDSGSISIECGRFFAARGKTEDACGEFETAYLNYGVPLAELAKDILASPAVRDRFFALYPRSQAEILDAVFPKDPFAR